MKKPIVVDLFCGCGGFGLGAKLAGFDSRVAVDIDKTLQSAYKLNFPDTQVITADITELGHEQWSMFLKGNKPGDISYPDGIIGGPPCQGFSRIGKRDAADPRNTLISHYFRHVKLLKPKFFVMENVEGLLDEGTVDVLMTELQNISTDKALNYTILEPIVIKASEYGAPTTRTRVIIVGYNPDEMNPLDENDFLPEVDVPKVTVRDAIADLPEPFRASRKSGDFAWAKYKNMNGRKISNYAKNARALPTKNFGDSEMIERLKKRELTGFDITLHNAEVEARYGALPNGKIDPVSKSKKLEWNGFCPTLRAGTGSDKGSYQAVRPLHPKMPRVITVREAARLQGFPDWFAFHETKWNSFRMIGNSVSPIISEFILSTIKNKLEIKIAPKCDAL